jgi:hypothetical protein
MRTAPSLNSSADGVRPSKNMRELFNSDAGMLHRFSV